jgi:hypothetical protein
VTNGSEPLSPAAQADLSRQWIAAIVASAVVGFVMGGIAYATRQAFDLTTPNAGALATLFLFATEIVTAVPSFAVYANRTGAVLRAKLPRFPQLTWNALHVMLGIGLGIVVASLELGTEPAPPDAPASGSEVVTGLAIGGVIAGAMLGAAIGWLQGRVLRKAARSVGRWIGFSTLGGTALGLIALTEYIPGDRSSTSETLTLGVGALIAIVAGVALLPALHRLEPH